MSRFTTHTHRKKKVIQSDPDLTRPRFNAAIFRVRFSFGFFLEKLKAGKMEIEVLLLTTELRFLR